MLIGLLAAGIAALAFGVAAVLQAIGARHEPIASGLDLLLLFRLLRHPVFLVSVLLSACGFGLHMLALRTLPLFAVQPVIASSVAVTAVIQARAGHEPLGPRRWWLVMAVCVGLALVTCAAVASNVVHTSAEWRTMLIAAAVGVGVCGWLAGGLQGATGASLLGLLSGLGFAVVAVSGRAFPSLAPASLLRDPASVALALGGGIAFLLYSTALQRGTVITATATMAVGNTIAPVLVGVLALGDRIRDGWIPAAALGLLLAGTASVLLQDAREGAPAGAPRPRQHPLASDPGPARR